MNYNRGTAHMFDNATTYHLEVEHTQAGGWLLGGAIDYGPAPGFGAAYAVTAGLAQRRGRFRFEESLGLGFAREYGYSTVVTSSSVTGQSSISTLSTSTELYARLFVRASVPVWRNWALVANVGLRGSPFDAPGDILAEGTIGARLELP